MTSILPTTKEGYNSLLREGVCEVIFTKKDGTERTMLATLKPDTIDQNGLTPVGGGSVVPDTQIRCIDVEKMAWRSFNIDTIISFKPILI